MYRGDASQFLRRDPSKPRAIEILVERTKRVMRPSIPLVGQVAAGTPILAEENIEDQLEIPAVIGADDGDYALKVQGDSMQDAGILGGDYVVVHPADDADNGEIVVAMIEDEATVKRLFREGESVRLQPENDAYEPIISREAQVLGKVIGVFRKV